MVDITTYPASRNDYPTYITSPLEHNPKFFYWNLVYPSPSQETSFVSNEGRFSPALSHLHLIIELLKKAQILDPVVPFVDLLFKLCGLCAFQKRI